MPLIERDSYSTNTASDISFAHVNNLVLSLVNGPSDESIKHATGFLMHPGTSAELPRSYLKHLKQIRPLLHKRLTKIIRTAKARMK